MPPGSDVLSLENEPEATFRRAGKKGALGFDPNIVRLPHRLSHIKDALSGTLAQKRRIDTAFRVKVTRAVGKTDGVFLSGKDDLPTNVSDLAQSAIEGIPVSAHRFIMTKIGLQNACPGALPCAVRQQMSPCFIVHSLKAVFKAPEPASEESAVQTHRMMSASRSAPTDTYLMGAPTWASMNST